MVLGVEKGWWWRLRKGKERKGGDLLSSRSFFFLLFLFSFFSLSLSLLSLTSPRPGWPPPPCRRTPCESRRRARLAGRRRRPRGSRGLERVFWVLIDRSRGEESRASERIKLSLCEKEKNLSFLLLTADVVEVEHPLDRGRLQVEEDGLRGAGEDLPE